MSILSDYHAESVLGALGRDLIQDLERLRPGLPDASSDDGAAMAQAIVRSRARLRLAELYREGFAAAEEALQEGELLALYQREVEQILLPRYLTLVKHRQLAERAAHTPWRGADAFNRLAWAGLFAALGAFIIWAPFIPIWAEWVPFAMAAAALFFAPVLPDLHRRFGEHRHQVALLSVIIDVDQAGRALPSTPMKPALPPRHEPKVTTKEPS